MLFGSAARGELNDESDFDLLVVGDGEAPRLPSPGRRAAASVLHRSPAWLLRQTSEGQLFALHLQLEGRVLHDPTGVLASFLRTPVRVPFQERLDQAREACAVLYAKDADLTTRSAFAVARHLLRTVAFLSCASRGCPTFSHRRASRVLEAPELASLLSRSAPMDSLPRMRGALEALVGAPSRVGWSLRNLAVEPSSGDLAAQLMRDEPCVSYDPQPDREQDAAAA